MGLNEGIVDSNNLNVVVLNTIGLSEDEASESERARIVLTHFGRPGIKLAESRETLAAAHLQYVQYDRSR